MTKRREGAERNGLFIVMLPKAHLTSHSGCLALHE